mmetsp:Transcript_32112/g.76680  ORF Transcript_32112/g.76680 Transcript_32112/m.76680 type:complete len:214 (+) Transcript_32112:94-735(+)
MKCRLDCLALDIDQVVPGQAKRLGQVVHLGGEIAREKSYIVSVDAEQHLLRLPPPVQEVVIREAVDFLRDHVRCWTQLDSNAAFLENAADDSLPEGIRQEGDVAQAPDVQVNHAINDKLALLIILDFRSVKGNWQISEGGLPLQQSWQQVGRHAGLRGVATNVDAHHQVRMLLAKMQNIIDLSQSRLFAGHLPPVQAEKHLYLHDKAEFRQGL